MSENEIKPAKTFLGFIWLLLRFLFTAPMALFVFLVMASVAGFFILIFAALLGML